MRTLSIIAVFGLAFSLPLAGAAVAHDSFLAKRFGDWTLVNGHWGEGDDAYAASRIVNVAAHNASGATAEVEADDRGNHVALIPGDDAAVLAATYASGFWTKDTDDEWHNQPKNEVENGRLAGEYHRHTIAVIEAAEAFTPFGLPLEIVPDSDPLALEPGAELGVTVLADGEPLANVELGSLAPGIDPVMTDAKGYAVWTIQPGANILLVASSTAHPEPEKADQLSHKATLSFMITDSH